MIFLPTGFLQMGHSDILSAQSWQVPCPQRKTQFFRRSMQTWHSDWRRGTWHKHGTTSTGSINVVLLQGSSVIYQQKWNRSFAVEGHGLIFRLKAEQLLAVWKSREEMGPSRGYTNKIILHRNCLTPCYASYKLHPQRLSSSPWSILYMSTLPTGDLV